MSIEANPNKFFSNITGLLTSARKPYITPAEASSRLTSISDDRSRELESFRIKQNNHFHDIVDPNRICIGGSKEALLIVGSPTKSFFHNRHPIVMIGRHRRKY